MIGDVKGLAIGFAVMCACDTAPAPRTVTITTPASSQSTAPIAVVTHVAPGNVPTAFFPPGTFAPAVDGFVSDWYGKHLKVMNEPSLWASAARGETAYRFLWLRTWGRPVAVRITTDGARGHLVATRLTGDGGYDPGAIDVHRERDLSKAEVARIESALAAASYDAIATEGEMGNDGAQWVIERAKGGAYRLVERWSPRLDPKQAAFVNACDVFLDLAGRDLATGSMY